MGHVQNPPASKSTRSKSTQSNLRTAYQSRVWGKTGSKKHIKTNKENSKKFSNKFINNENLNFIGWILNAGGF